MDPEAVIENARGEIDERLLTGTEGGILSRAVLADDPLIAYLHEEEVLQYLLAGAAAPTIVRREGTDPVETEGSYRTLLAVTDARLLVVAGSEGGDRAVSLRYDEVAAVEHSAGVLTHSVLVRETPDRGLEVEVASGSDPAEAVDYARRRVETATDSDEWATPGRDESAQGKVDSELASDGASEVQFGHTPGPSNAGKTSEADSGWGLTDWAHEVATDRLNGGATGEPNGGATGELDEPGSAEVSESSAPVAGDTSVGEPDTASDSPSWSLTDPTSFETTSDSADSRDRPNTSSSNTSGTSMGSQPSRNPMDSPAHETTGSEPLEDAGDPGTQPDLGAWIDPGTEVDPGSGVDPGTEGRSEERPASESPSARDTTETEPDLIESLFEALIEDANPGIEGPVTGGIGGLVRDVAQYARQVDEHLAAGALGDARAAAATADLLGTETERIAAERDRPELRDRIESLRTQVRRAVIAAEFGLDLEALETGPSGADPGDVLRRLMQNVDPYEFEHLVANLWEELGYQTAVTQSSQDLGVDVVARQVTPVEQTVVIQAKRYGPNTKVGREEIQQYASLHRQERDADLVVVVTTGECTGPAEEAAADLNVKLVDGDRLVELINEYELYDVVVEYANAESE